MSHYRCIRKLYSEFEFESRLLKAIQQKTGDLSEVFDTNCVFRFAADRDGNRFQCFLYRTSGNPLIAETAKPHRDYLRRTMSKVTRASISISDEPPVSPQPGSRPSVKLFRMGLEGRDIAVIGAPDSQSDEIHRNGCLA